MHQRLLRSVFAVCLLSQCLLWSQNSAAPLRDRKTVDSDGDGLSDHEDPHPFVAEIRSLSWKITPLRLGWKVDQAYEKNIAIFDETEKSYLRQDHFRFGVDADARGEARTEVKGGLSGNPLKLFGLADTDAKTRFSTKFSASSQISWNRNTKKTASDLHRMVDEIRFSQYLSELHVDFDVEFYNQTENTDFESTGSLQIPIKGSPNGHVFVWAQPWGANGPIQRIDLPAGRKKTTISFRAELKTTNALDLLTWMKTSSPTIDLMEIQGKISPVDGSGDAITTLAKIGEKTREISVDADGEIFSWKIAMKDESTGKKLSLRDALAAINALVPEFGGKGKVFEFTDHYLRSACGSDNSIYPLRWWMAAVPGQSGFRDVDPSVLVERDVFLQYRYGFPVDIDRWAPLAENARGKDPWISLVAGLACLQANDPKAEKYLGVAKNSAVAKVALAAGLAGVEANVERAGELLMEAGKTNDPLALVALAEVRDEKRWGFKNEVGSARSLLESAAGMKFSPALVRLGLGYRDGRFGLPKNRQEAMRKFEEARALGDVEAMAILGESNGEAMLEDARELGYTPTAEVGSVLDSLAGRALPFENSLGMKFVRVEGTDVLFCEHETRVRDFAEFVDKTGYTGEPNPVALKDIWLQHEHEGHEQTPDHPVVNVSWEDAKAFCAWLSEKEGRLYRLPTDHEWSIAVGIGGQENATASPQEKSGKVPDFPWGNAWPPPNGAGNFDEIDDYTDPHAFTAPVKSYNIGKHGLYDLSGNVWEWCEDWYSGERKYRVLRGGSWRTDSEIHLRSSFRNPGHPSARNRNNGFRCVVSAAR